MLNSLKTDNCDPLFYHSLRKEIHKKNIGCKESKGRPLLDLIFKGYFLIKVLSTIIIVIRPRFELCGRNFGELAPLKRPILISFLCAGYSKQPFKNQSTGRCPRHCKKVKIQTLFRSLYSFRFKVLFLIRHMQILQKYNRRGPSSFLPFFPLAREDRIGF
jgi:hypothetical protein